MGVYIQGSNTKGRLEGCDISRNTLVGASICGGADPVLVGCKFFGSLEGGGVLFEGSGTKGRLEDCDVWDNELSGLEVRAGADPLITSSRIHDGKGGGIHIHDDGTKGALERNSIFRNAGTGGIYCAQGAAPMITHNRIFENSVNITFDGSSTGGRLLSNAIVASGETGVRITNGGEPLVAANLIDGSGEVGLPFNPRPLRHVCLCAFLPHSLFADPPFWNAMFFHFQTLPLFVPLLARRVCWTFPPLKC